MGIGLLLWTCGGCGTGEYERRLNARISALSEETPFKTKLYAPSELAGTPVTVRVPKVFKQSWVEGSTAEDGKQIDPRRVKPGAMELPELKITYESFAPFQEGQAAYCCYFGAKETPKVRAGDPSDVFWNQFQNGAKFPDIHYQRDDAQCATPEGRGLAWKKIHATCPQEFYYVDADGKGKFRILPGIIEIYVREESGYTITVVWRVPEEIAEEVGLAELAALVGGCVALKGSP